MATTARPLAVFLFLLLLAVQLVEGSKSRNSERDALRAFRAGVSDPSGTLQSWNSTAHFCRWEGVICDHGHVTSLGVSGLSGSISPAIGNLTYLETLNFSKNAFSGSIPATLGRLRRLSYLSFCDNGLSGVIPDSLRNCTGLAYVYLNNNSLAGAIPDWLGTMPNLTYLWLYGNSLSGDIPLSLDNLTNLESLKLDQNLLQGNLPVGLSRLPLLQTLTVSQNKLDGDIPPGFFNMSFLADMSLADNAFRGSLPPYAGAGMKNLGGLFLGGNRLTGLIPATLANASGMTYLSLSDNGFSGRVPHEIGTLCLYALEISNNELAATDGVGWEFLDRLTNCSGLRRLSLDNNNFSGRMPISISSLSRELLELNLGGNRMSGSIPPSIGNLTALQTLGLESNLLTGTIPDGIGKLKNLMELRLQENKLSGTVPSSIGSLTKMLKLVLSSNVLSGSIPPTLGNLQEMVLLNLSANKLTGQVPTQLFDLPSLSQAMDLSNNRLEGPLPRDVIRLGNLAFLKLSRNFFNGEIPEQLDSCQSLELLDLDSNLFNGTIPLSLSKLKGLRRLNLTSNRLSGSIPSELGDMPGLQELYLSWNNLTGVIPDELGNASSLIKMDVSYNHLEGQVPLHGVLANLTGLNIAGNSELCGGVPQLHLLRCPVARHTQHTDWRLPIVVPIFGISLFSGMFLAIFLCYKRKSRHGESTTQPDILDGMNYERISYAELAKATDGFADSNLIGAGKFGSVYKGTLPLKVKEGFEHGTVAVKVFDLQQVGASKTFLSECEALRTIRHRNLISIITCCSSITPRGDEFRALVFELMPNYSLDRWLHPTPEALKNVGRLTAIQRLNIVVDIADALHYLHHSCVPPIIHCDLKPSNVLLGEDMTACIGDFGLAKLLLDPGIQDIASSESTIGIRGTIGYVAPEYGTTGKVSTNGDTYSFGITLLEIFSGKSPTEDSFEDGQTLQGFVGAAFPDRTEEVLDTTMLVTTEFDGDYSGVSVRDCLVSAIRVGLSCTRAAPYERMSMRDAAAELRTIRDACLSA
ncbi:uncharacterized protein [Lolium perenne]|uniref:uncharacterized protein n=1 Tax=Lolium perenne TaxID=4522 RepID=UPI0021F685F0|nr:probable LRR receptor-like serine/threonine-protein kinase At3g47570 [Lolium perenne]